MSTHVFFFFPNHNSSRAFQIRDNEKLRRRPLFGLVILWTMGLKSIDEINYYCGTKRTISDYGIRFYTVRILLNSTTNPHIVVCLSQSERLDLSTPNASFAISLCLSRNRWIEGWNWVFSRIILLRRSHYCNAGVLAESISATHRITRRWQKYEHRKKRTYAETTKISGKSSKLAIFGQQLCIQ